MKSILLLPTPVDPVAHPALIAIDVPIPSL
jgi:hypothetical protein